MKTMFFMFGSFLLFIVTPLFATTADRCQASFEALEETKDEITGLPYVYLTVSLLEDCAVEDSNLKLTKGDNLLAFTSATEIFFSMAKYRNLNKGQHIEISLKRDNPCGEGCQSGVSGHKIKILKE